MGGDVVIAQRKGRRTAQSARTAMTARWLSMILLALWLAALLPGTALAAPVAKPAGGVMSAEMAAVVKETQARVPWHSSIRAYDVDAKAMLVAISQRIQEVEIVLPTYGLVRFAFQRVSQRTSSSTWYGESQQGDRVTFSVDNIEGAVLVHLNMRDGKYWQIDRLSRSPQYFLLEIDSTRLPRGNDVLPVPPRTPTPGPPSGASGSLTGSPPPGLELRIGLPQRPLPPGLRLRSTEMKEYIRVPLPLTIAPTNPTTSMFLAATALGENTPDKVIHILVAFTREAYSNTQNIPNRAENEFDWFNESLNKTPYSATRLGAFEVVEESTAGRLGAVILSQLEQPADGVLDTIHGLRMKWEADLVMLVVKGPLRHYDTKQQKEVTICGLARQMLPATYADTRNHPFFLVSSDCLGNSDLKVLAHEVGHIAGAMHDDESTPGPYHAHVRPFVTELATRPRQTIMAVTCPACLLGTDWSNPETKYCFPMSNPLCSPFDTGTCGVGSCRGSGGICIPLTLTSCHPMGVAGHSETLNLWKSPRPLDLANMPKVPKAGSVASVTALLLID